MVMYYLKGLNVSIEKPILIQSHRSGPKIKLYKWNFSTSKIHQKISLKFTQKFMLKYQKLTIFSPKIHYFRMGLFFIDSSENLLKNYVINVFDSSYFF